MTPNVALNLPPLENGDRLTRSQFERRYAASPTIRKAELIEGVVCVVSPVRANQHGRPHATIMAWLGVYWIATPGVTLYDNATVRLDEDNEPQPDALYYALNRKWGETLPLAMTIISKAHPN